MNIKKQVAAWVFSVRDTQSDPRAYYDGRAFYCTLYSDGSFAFYPHDDMKILYDDDFMRGSQAWSELGTRKSESHREEFSVEIDGVDQAIVDRILSFPQDARGQIEVDEYQEQWLNEMLEPFFWNKVNPLLATPLQRRK